MAKIKVKNKNTPLIDKSTIFKRFTDPLFEPIFEGGLLPEIVVSGPSPRWLKIKDKISKEYTKDKFIDESLPKFSRSIGVSANNLAEGSLIQYEKNLNDKVVKELLETNPRKGKKSENNLEWYNSFSPKERELIQGSSYSKKFLPAERAYNQDVGNKAKEEGIISNFSSAENIKRTGQGLSERGRLFPNAENNIESWVNPFVMAGDMAKGLSEAPTDIKEGNYGKAALSVASPLLVGGLSGMGAKTTGQFLNNAFNPLAGTKDLVNNLGNKYLPNAYRYNPLAIKENNEMLLYRARPIGQNPDINMAAQLKAKEAAGEPLKWYQKNLLNPQTNPEIIAREKYYGRWFEKNPERLDFYIDPGRRNFADEETIEILRTKLPKSEANKFNVGNFEDVKRLTLSPETEFILPKEMVNSAERFPENYWQELIKQDKAFNTPHWLKGYKEIDVPKSNFKSEIDWEKWNKEIPSNQPLLQEYNLIEQQAKANGSWMKNPDGSKFQGTPEQFVQQNSKNFKKAFGNSKLVNSDGSPTIQYHAGKKGYEEFLTPQDKGYVKRDTYTGDQGIYFTPSKSRAKSYSRNIPKNEREIYETYINMENPYSGRIKGTYGKDQITNKQYEELLSSNYDGVIDKNLFPYPRQTITFDPKNIKSAVGNNGMFDMSNPNIYKIITAGALGTQYLKNQQEDPKEFANGGGYTSSIRTTDPNDPRLKMYQDSLNLYNTSKFNSFTEKQVNPLKFEKFIPYNNLPKINDQLENFELGDMTIMKGNKIKISNTGKVNTSKESYPLNTEREREIFYNTQYKDKEELYKKINPNNKPLGFNKYTDTFSDGRVYNQYSLQYKKPNQLVEYKRWEDTTKMNPMNTNIQGSNKVSVDLSKRQVQQSPQNFSLTFPEKETMQNAGNPTRTLRYNTEEEMRNSMDYIKSKTGVFPDRTTFRGDGTEGSAGYTSYFDEISKDINKEFADGGNTNYGLREDGTQKGQGWLGEIPILRGREKGSVATELSIGVDDKLLPSIVPGLSEKEIRFIQKGKFIFGNNSKRSKSIISKAIEHSYKMDDEGRGYFYEDINPTPFANGGQINKFDNGGYTKEELELIKNASTAEQLKTIEGQIAKRKAAEESNAWYAKAADKATAPPLIDVNKIKEKIVNLKDKGFEYIHNTFRDTDIQKTPTSVTPKNTNTSKSPILNNTDTIPIGLNELYRVPDKHWRAAKTDSLWSYENAWDNKEGFNYVTSPVLKNDTNTKYQNVKGIAQFILDSDISSPIEKRNKYHNYPSKENDWVLYNKKNNNGEYNVKYDLFKNKDQYSKQGYTGDLKVRNYKLSDIDFDNKEGRESTNYGWGSKYTASKSGVKIPLVVDNKSDDIYQRFGGGSVVFAFKEPSTGKDIRIDFAGSPNEIKRYSNTLITKYKIDPRKVDVLIHDAGSYSAKPVSNSNNILRQNQYNNFNIDKDGGGSLMIPSNYNKKGGISTIHKFADGGQGIPFMNKPSLVEKLTTPIFNISAPNKNSNINIEKFQQSKQDKETKKVDKVNFYETLNFKNWGLNDYSDYSSFNSAFKNSRDNKEKEFVYKGERYNTNLIPKEESDLYNESKSFLEHYYKNNNFKPIKESDISTDYDMWDKYTLEKYGDTWGNVLNQNTLEGTEKEYNDWIKKGNLLSPFTEDEKGNRINRLGTDKEFREFYRKSINQIEINKLNDPSYYFSITNSKPKDMSSDGHVDERTSDKKIFINSKGQEGKLNTTHIHELSHKADDYQVYKRTPKINTKIIDINNYPMDQDGFNYLSNPSEIEARKMSTLFFMYKNNIDINKMTVKDLDNFYIENKDKLPYDINQLRDLYMYQKEDLLKFLKNDFSYLKNNSSKEFANGGQVREYKRTVTPYKSIKEKKKEQVYPDMKKKFNDYLNQ